MQQDAHLSSSGYVLNKRLSTHPSAQIDQDATIRKAQVLPQSKPFHTGLLKLEGFGFSLLFIFIHFLQFSNSASNKGMFDLFLSYFSVAMAKYHGQNTYKRNSLFGDNSFRTLQSMTISVGSTAASGQTWC